MHMEKEKEGGMMEENDEINSNSNGPSPSCSKAKVWDCGSTLYDSFELNSFKRQLDSAIANSSRSLSMPRRMPAPAPVKKEKEKAKAFNISRSLQKLVRSVFKPNAGNNNNNNISRCSSRSSRDGYLVVYEYDKSGPLLTTIPELPDFETASLSLSPDLTSSFVKRSASHRFPSTSLGISCA